MFAVWSARLGPRSDRLPAAAPPVSGDVLPQSAHSSLERQRGKGKNAGSASSSALGCTQQHSSPGPGQTEAPTPGPRGYVGTAPAALLTPHGTGPCGSSTQRPLRVPGHLGLSTIVQLSGHKNIKKQSSQTHTNRKGKGKPRVL